MKAYFLSLKNDTPTSGYWDYAILEELLVGFEKVEVRSLPDDQSAVVVIPARSHGELIDQINEELKKIQSVVLFLMGDEESVFPVEKITHSQIHIWVQNPSPGRHDAYKKLGCGYTPHTLAYRSEVPTKDTKFFFAGQITHERRKEMARVLRKKEGILLETAGFTQGMDPQEYCRHISQARVVPCPSGPVTPDTFRVYEALELGAIPIADEATPEYEIPGYWNWLFNEDVPFPRYIKTKELVQNVNFIPAMYPRLNNHVQAWWYRWKQETKSEIRFQANYYPSDLKDEVTVIVPVSPISSHPNTDILEETIGNIRYHLPNSEIILTFDGVRKEQDHLFEVYHEHIRKVLWLCREWKNVTPYIFDEHTHQVGMARKVLEKVNTPIILYVEQDTPLVIDEPIEWEKLIEELLDENANMIRFHFEGVIPEAHNHLMIGQPENGLLKTVQWSQRPHLARTSFYVKMLEKYFTPTANCFIEDKIHGCVQDDWGLYGEAGWEKWKMFIYHPMTGNIKRSYHTDGRSGEKKFDERQTW